MLSKLMYGCFFWDINLVLGKTIGPGRGGYREAALQC